MRSRSIPFHLRIIFRSSPYMYYTNVWCKVFVFAQISHILAYTYLKSKKINNARTPFFKANFAIEEERNWLMEATSKIIIFILFLSQPKNIILIEVVSFSKLPNQDIHHQRTLSSFPTSNRRSLCTSYSKFTFVSNMKKCSSSYQPSRMFVRRFCS